MILLAAFISLFAPSARADVFSQDPLCANQDFFRKDYEQATAVHRKYPQLRHAYGEQQKWFRAVTGSMSAACEDDKKFAASLVARKKGENTGQCAPEEETATYDLDVLEHSEQRLKKLVDDKNAFLKKGVPGVTKPLLEVARADRSALYDYAFTLMEVPLEGYCELKWLYPPAMLEHLRGGKDCPALAAYDKPAPEDKSGPALFQKLLTRFALSVTYNTARRDKAAASARVSLDRYQKCVSQIQGLKPNPQLSSRGKVLGLGAPAKVRQGKSRKNGSDITGTEEADKKDKKLPY